MCETNDWKFVCKKIRDAIEKEINNHVSNWQGDSMIDKLINEIDEDLIDYNSKGYDISKEEFLRNEMDNL